MSILLSIHFDGAHHTYLFHFLLKDLLQIISLSQVFSSLGNYNCAIIKSFFPGLQHLNYFISRARITTHLKIFKNESMNSLFKIPTNVVIEETLSNINKG